MQRYAIIIVILLLVLTAGCASTKDKPTAASSAEQVHNAFNDDVNAKPAMRQRQTQSKQPVSSLLPLVETKLEAQSKPPPQPTQEPPQVRFDLNVENGSVREVLMSLVKGTRQNMIVHPSVQGSVSLSLKAVTVDDVLQALRSVYGYEFRRTAIGYEVSTSDMQTRLFKVDYLNVKRSGESQVRVSSGQLTEKKSNGNNNATAQQDNQKQKPGQSLSGSEVNTRSVSDFWLDLQTALEAMVGEEAGRKVVVNSHTGIVVVRAMPTELRNVENYLNTIQGTIQRQVILEAKIVEVELSEGFQAGINWAAFVRSGSNAANIGQVGGGSVFSGDGVSDLAGSEFNLANLSEFESLASSAFGGVFSMAIATHDFTAFIEALEKQGDVHVLSSPRVSTVNNQKAVIKVGTDEFFVTGIETNTTQANNNFNTSINVELTPFFSGVALDVIPQIDASGEVTLHIHPAVSDVKEKTKEVQVSSGEEGILKVPLALSTIRESDSIIRAKSGQVVVIGGLMQTVVQDNEAGVPYLSKVPIFGGLFRHQKQVSIKSELVILLRPIIVDDYGVWDEYMDLTRERFDRLTQYQSSPVFDQGQVPKPADSLAPAQ
jgi:MSHA biogenesis protein MshL